MDREAVDMRLIALYTIARIVFGLTALAAPKTVGRLLAGDGGALPDATAFLRGMGGRYRNPQQRRRPSWTGRRNARRHQRRRRHRQRMASHAARKKTAGAGHGRRVSDSRCRFGGDQPRIIEPASGYSILARNCIAVGSISLNLLAPRTYSCRAVFGGIAL